MMGWPRLPVDSGPSAVRCGHSIRPGLTPIRRAACLGRRLWLTLGLGLCGTLLVATSAHADEFRWTKRWGQSELTVSINRTSARVGEPVWLKVELWTPPGIRVVMPDFSDRIGDFALLSIEALNDLPAKGGRRWERRLELECLLPGEHEVPSVTILLRDDQAGASAASGPIGRLETDPITVTIQSVLKGEPEPWSIRDIDGTVDMQAPPPRQNGVSAWVVSGAATVMLAAAIGWWILRRRTKEPAPWEWAWQALERLRGDASFRTPERTAPLYAELTRIVRQYVERRFDIAAPKQTTAEFLRSARTHPALDEEHRELLGAFLTRADLMKFGGGVPMSQEVESGFAAAARFIRMTAATDAADLPTRTEVE